MNTETEAKIKQQILRCGNNAHHMRNILYQIFDDQIPEVLILSDEASRIEGLCHDILRTSLNFRYLSWFEGWKVALRKIKRHIKVSQRIVLSCDDSLYKAFSEEVKEQLIEFLKLEEELSENVDSYLNKLFIQFSDGSCESIKYTESFDSKLYNQMDFEVLNSKPIEENSIKQLDDLIMVALECSNRAHNIQNYIVPYQAKQGFEGYANTIVGHSGEIEQQFREIQKNLKMHSHNLNEMKTYIKNHATYAKTKINSILENLSGIQNDTSFKKQENIANICNILEKTCDFFSDKLTDQMVNSAA